MKNTEDKHVYIESFRPVADHNSRVLLLGTMPGEESLKQQQYYAHPRNLFWPMLYHVFNEPMQTDYKKRLQLLHDKGIALWDVFKSCIREGSLDSNIHHEELNDIPGLLEEFPAIRFVLCNGETAWKQFQQKVLPRIKRPVYALRLPSTSPANASVPYEIKVNQWMQLRHTLEKRVLFQTSFKTKAGMFSVVCDEEKVLGICLPGGEMPAWEGYAVFSGNELCEKAAEQIREYLSGERMEFNLPFTLPGTPFEQKVYQALIQVPYADTVSYGRLAEMAGNSKAARAVGQTVRKNPLPLLIPCHRVIGSNGRNIGFMGIRGNPLQMEFLELEKKNRINPDR